jgi:hypothetical protein
MRSMKERPPAATLREDGNYDISGLGISIGGKSVSTLGGACFATLRETMLPGGPANAVEERMFQEWLERYLRERIHLIRLPVPGFEVLDGTTCVSWTGNAWEVLLVEEFF